MTLAEIQPAIREALLRHPDLASLPVILDDGTGEANRERATALKTRGLCLLVWRPEAGGITAESPTGAVVCEVLVLVFVEESRVVNRGEGGTGIAAEVATQKVMSALSGARVGHQRVALDSPPFDNLGAVNGVARFLVSGVVELPVVPL
ncbi:MAG: hypothetical protein LDL56_04355 [Armatimonadetes bacterium]|nr:hypothetical protein [Armatimonadota bacterium]